MPKPKGANADFHRERAAAIMREYHHAVSSVPRGVTFSRADILRRVANAPCERFWVSLTRAMAVIPAMLDGRPLPRMRRSKVEMFEEIARRVRCGLELYPETPLRQIVDDVICSPAPRFYLSLESIKIIIYKEKKKWYQRHMPRILRSSLQSQS